MLTILNSTNITCIYSSLCWTNISCKFECSANFYAFIIHARCTYQADTARWNKFYATAVITTAIANFNCNIWKKLQTFFFVSHQPEISTTFCGKLFKSLFAKRKKCGKKCPKQHWTLDRIEAMVKKSVVYKMLEFHLLWRLANIKLYPLFFDLSGWKFYNHHHDILITMCSLDYHHWQTNFWHSIHSCQSSTKAYSQKFLFNVTQLIGPKSNWPITPPSLSIISSCGIID